MPLSTYWQPINITADFICMTLPKSNGDQNCTLYANKNAIILLLFVTAGNHKSNLSSSLLNCH